MYSTVTPGGPNTHTHTENEHIDKTRAFGAVSIWARERKLGSHMLFLDARQSAVWGEDDVGCHRGQTQKPVGRTSPKQMSTKRKNELAQ